MAEINIQRKKKSVWPWVLALLIVVGLAVFLYFMFGTGPGNPVGRPAETGYKIPEAFQFNASMINKMYIEDLRT
jgi:hypothetical protein